MATPIRPSTFLRAAALTAGLLAASLDARAATYFWDADGNPTNSGYGGDGEWSTAATNWNTSATIGAGSLIVWSNLADGASFLRGTTGNVTVVTSGITALSIGVGSSTGSFTTGSANYTFSGGPITLLQTNFNSVVSVSSGSTVVFSNALNFAGANTKVTVNNAGVTPITFAGGIQNTAATNASELKFTSFGSAGSFFDVTGNLTKSTATNNFTLIVGEAGASASGTVVRLAGNNTGIGGVSTLNRGTLYLNHNGALGGASGLTVANVTPAAADSTAVLIGVAGVTNAKTITFAGTSDTNDVRVVGSDITSGTATFTGGFTLGQFASNGIGSTLQITQAAGGTTIMSGLISDGANTSGITKVGAGTVILSRAAGNTYDGTTFVSAGALLVNNTTGSGLGTGGVSVNGGKLGGTGTINGSINLGSAGTFAPGASIETLGTGTLTFGTGSKLEYEVDSSVATSVGADLAKVSGGLNLSGVVSLTLTNLAAIPLAFVDNTTFSLINYTGSWNGGFFTYGLDVLTNGAQFSFNGQDWTIDYAATSGGVNFSGEYVPGNFVNITAVPEPATWALLVLGASAVWFVRRRRT